MKGAFEVSPSQRAALLGPVHKISLLFAIKAPLHQFLLLFVVFSQDQNPSPQRSLRTRSGTAFNSSQQRGNESELMLNQIVGVVVPILI